MEDKITIQTPDLKKYLDILKETLSEKNYNAIVGSSMRKGLNETILKPLKSAIPYTSLKPGVSIIRYKKAKLGYVTGIIAKKRDKKNPEALPAGVILRFLEGGTKVRIVNGVSRGKINPRHIVSPVLINTQRAFLDFLVKDFGETLEDQINKKMKTLKKKLK